MARKTVGLQLGDSLMILAMWAWLTWGVGPVWLGFAILGGTMVFNMLGQLMDKVG